MYVSLSSIFVLLLFAQCAMAQPTVERTLPERGYLPGLSFMVSLSIPAIAGEFSLIEIPPLGWKISDISTLYVGKEGQITIPLRQYPKHRTITYFVTPPLSATGVYTFSGHMDKKETVGMTTITPMNPEPMGIFENHADLGIVAYSKSNYDRSSDTYTIEVGLSPNTFFNSHFVYKEVTGDCSIQAHAVACNDDPNVSDFSTVALGIYDSLSIDSQWLGIETKASGVSWFGMGLGPYSLDRAIQVAWPPFHDGWMRIERRGDAMRVFYFDTDLNEWPIAVEISMYFKDSVYIGIQASCFIGTYNIGTFDHVELTFDSPASIPNWDLF